MKLSEMCEIKMGQSPESSTYNEEGNGLPFFQGNADFGKIHPSVRVWCSSPVKIALPNDILISVRAPVGALNIADTKCCIGRGLAALTVNESVCNAGYLWYALQSKVNELNAKGTGSTFKAINKAALADTEIPYVPLDEQKKIADIFDKLSFAIDKRDRQIEILNLLVKSRFVEMFGDNKYESVKASDVCDFITKGTTPSAGEIYESYAESRVPYLKVYNLSFTGELLFNSEPQYISIDVHNGKLARSKVFPNDVLMNIVGPPLGKFSLVTDEYNEWNINQAIAIFRAKERVLPRYLMTALMQPNVLRPFVEQAVGVRQLNLSLEQCRNLEFPLPPIERQKQFVELSEKTDKSKYCICLSLKNLCTIHKNLIGGYSK